MNKSAWVIKKGVNQNEELPCPLKTSQQGVEAPVFLAWPTLSIHDPPGEQEQSNSNLKIVIYPFNDSKVHSFTFTFRSAGTVKSHWQCRNFNLYHSGDFIDKERPPQGMGRGLFKFSFAKENIKYKTTHTHIYSSILSVMPACSFCSCNISNLNPNYLAYS